jgi:hypothetical protein
LHSYEDVYQSWVTVFDIATNDDWFGVIVLGTKFSSKVPSVLYCVILAYMINLTTLKLVLAVILDGFSNYFLNKEKNET